MATNVVFTNPPYIDWSDGPTTMLSGEYCVEKSIGRRQIRSDHHGPLVLRDRRREAQSRGFVEQHREAELRFEEQALVGVHLIIGRQLGGAGQIEHAERIAVL